MISFPNAKINLGLNVLSKRSDGYHEIVSCLYPILDLHDILEIVPSDRFSFSSTGLPILGDSESNLVIKAYQLLKTKYSLPSVSIHLHKVIPMGAGLGGGSADGAFCLNMLNELFSLNLRQDVLSTYAAELGSDCPFFIKNEPSIVTGTGTVLNSIDLDLNNYLIELRHPDVHLDTKSAYDLIKPQNPLIDIRNIVSLPVSSWSTNLINDFQEPMIKKHPQIGTALMGLKKKGALYAAMTGSGSSVFGIFKK